VFTISREGAQDADRDGLLGANRPIPRLHTRVEIVNTL
jgi:hypothetical protein